MDTKLYSFMLKWERTSTFATSIYVTNYVSNYMPQVLMHVFMKSLNDKPRGFQALISAKCQIVNALNTQGLHNIIIQS